jgi:diaminohydroxyphosphoribosylaminopyrimidine deaminase/5-amino-6-(5-phosphoribosylamino)uracil reductase
MEKDILYMQKSLSLAKKGQGCTSPNPMVGAVLVKNNKIIAQGFHRICGSDHAEVSALKVAGSKAKGATMYVNLEPCAHWGRTPPCVDRIISSKIKRVVVAMIDPNPEVAGKSVRKMRRAGIKVRVGVLGKQARRLNEVFLKNIYEHKPFIAAKVAQTLDGKIATAAGESKWITSASTRKLARRLRDNYDAVVVGVNTANKDNPGLNGVDTKVSKVVIDPHLKIKNNLKLVTKTPEQLIVACSIDCQKTEKYNYLNNLGVTVLPVKVKDDLLNFNIFLKKIYRRGITSLFVEGGAETIGHFFDARCLDKFYFFFAPKIAGGRNALSSIAGEGIKKISCACKLKDMEIATVGNDFIVSGYPKFN